MYDFNNRVLLLTGANGGIGREVARLFYQYGASMVLADLDGDGLADFARELDASGERVATLRMNAADPADSAKAVQLAVERFGGIDFLVPSAGLYQSQPIRQMTDEQWRQTLGINLDGVFYLCQRAIPVLRANSAIVNLTSVAAHRGAFSNAHYGASKGGLLSLTRALAREWAADPGERGVPRDHRNPDDPAPDREPRQRFGGADPAQTPGSTERNRLGDRLSMQQRLKFHDRRSTARERRAVHRRMSLARLVFLPVERSSEK